MGRLTIGRHNIEGPYRQPASVPGLAGSPFFEQEAACPK